MNRAAQNRSAAGIILRRVYLGVVHVASCVHVLANVSAHFGLLHPQEDGGGTRQLAGGADDGRRPRAVRPMPSFAAAGFEGCS